MSGPLNHEVSTLELATMHVAVAPARVEMLMQQLEND
jgi:hypothetical protein